MFTEFMENTINKQMEMLNVSVFFLKKHIIYLSTFRL